MESSLLFWCIRYVYMFVFFLQRAVMRRFFRHIHDDCIYELRNINFNFIVFTFITVRTTYLGPELISLCSCLRQCNVAQISSTLRDQCRQKFGSQIISNDCWYASNLSHYIIFDHHAHWLFTRRRENQQKYRPIVTVSGSSFDNSNKDLRLNHRRKSFQTFWDPIWNVVASLCAWWKLVAFVAVCMCTSCVSRRFFVSLQKSYCVSFGFN